jgi:hypothetical protein
VNIDIKSIQGFNSNDKYTVEFGTTSSTGQFNIMMHGSPINTTNCNVQMPNIRFDHQLNRNQKFLQSADNPCESRFLPFVKPAKKSSVSVPKMGAGGPRHSTMDKKPKFGNHHYFYDPNDKIT